MFKYINIVLLMVFFIFSGHLSAEEELFELETTFIKGNKEMPQILYVVPWKDIKKSKRETQSLVLHSLFGNLFDPANPDEVLLSTTTK